MRYAVAFLVLLLAPVAGASAGVIPVPVALTGGDSDGVDVPFDRCPDRGVRGMVDHVGCPIDPMARFGDLDGDFLMNGPSVVVPRDSPLAATLIAADIVRGIRRDDGRWVFFGEESVGTDPRDPNTDGLDRYGDGFEVAMQYGLAPAARLGGTRAHVVEPEGAPRADPLAADEYLDLYPFVRGNVTYWNDALEAAVEQVVADDLAPEGNATYRPPPVRLHVFVENPIPIAADGVLTVESVLATGEGARIQQHLMRERFGVATYVLAPPVVRWQDEEVAGLAFDRYVLVGLDHKGFDACRAAGGGREAPACVELARLFRWTLNHERFHHYGLPDTSGEDTLMSTTTGVYTPRPAESAARFAWISEAPLVLRWH